MGRLEAARNLLLALALFMPVSATGAEDSPVREMMEVSGMVEQFADLGETFRAGINASGAGQMPPEFLEGLADIAAEHVSGPELVDELESNFELTLTPDQVAAVTAFYRTPLGRRLKEAEVAGSDVDARLELEAKRGELLAQLKDQPERMALARRIDDALLSSELAATTASAIGRAMMAGLLKGSLQGATPEMMAQMEEQLEALDQATRQQMRERIVVTFGWIYRDFSDADLAHYAEFLETEAARAVYASVNEVFYTYLSAGAAMIGEDFAALLRSKRT